MTRSLFFKTVVVGVGLVGRTKCGTQFHQWATQRLNDYLVQSYDIIKKRLEQKQLEVQMLKDGICILSRALEEKIVQSNWSS